MKIIITTKNLDLTPSLNVLVNQKVEKLRKFINVLKEKLPEKGKSLAEVFVEIEKVSKHHKKGDVFKTEIIIVLPGKKLVSEFKKYKSRSAELVRKEQKRAENKL